MKRHIQRQNEISMIRIELKECANVNGKITGILFVSFDTFDFPENNWNDFIVVILLWWVQELHEFLRSSKSVKLRFMDGPLAIKLVEDLNQIHVNCIYQDKTTYKANYPSDTFKPEICKEVISAAEKILKICEINSWHNEDIERLKKSLSNLKEYKF